MTKKKKWLEAVNKREQRKESEMVQEVMNLKNEKELWEFVNKRYKKENDIGIEHEEWEKEARKSICTKRYGSGVLERTNVKIMNSEEIKTEEVKEVIQELKTKKCAGPDGINGEVWKCANDECVTMLTRSINEVWMGNRMVPEEWKVGEVIPVYKSGDKSEVKNYRGITVTNTTYKIFAKILLKKLEIEVQEKQLLPLNQVGFVKGCSTIDNLVTLNFIIQKEIGKKRGKLYLLFLDLEKAYDCVNRVKLIECLKKLGVSVQLVNAIKMLYEDTKRRTRTGKEVSEYFETFTGLKQGCPLSPLLFNLYVADLEKVLSNAQAGGVIVGKKKIWSMSYADDVVCLAKSKEELREMMKTIGKYMDKRDLKVNVKKTKVMICGKGSRMSVNENFEWNMEKLEIVRCYKYLGFMIARNGSFSEHVRYVVKKTKVAMERMRWIFERKFSEAVHVKQAILKICVKSILMYGAELWGVKEECEIEKMQRKWLKKMLGVEKSTPEYILLQELNEWKIWGQAAEKLVRFEDRINNREGTGLVNLVYEAMNNEKCEVEWVKQRSELYKRVGWAIREVVTKREEGVNLANKFREIWKGVEGQERQKNIRESEYNKKYKSIQVFGKLPDYLCERNMGIGDKRIIARFRCGSEERGNRYWMNASERMCTMCGCDFETWEHWFNSCVRIHLTEEERKLGAFVVRSLNEKGKSVNLMKKILEEKKRTRILDE